MFYNSPVIDPSRPPKAHLYNGVLSDPNNKLDSFVSSAWRLNRSDRLDYQELIERALRTAVRKPSNA